MSGALKEVRDRIKSVKNTQQITKAMKMVSAAKLRKAQQAIVKMRPYADRLDKMLKNILSNLESGDMVTSYGEEREINNVLLVVSTSNRGLCGAFNSNLIKKCVELIETKYATHREKGNLTLLFIGKKGMDYFKKRYQLPMITEYVEYNNNLGFDNIATISQLIMDKYNEGSYDAVDVIYSSFKNAATQLPQSVQFLPVPKQSNDNKQESKNQTKADYIFEPSKKELLEYLIPSILQISFHKFLLDTNASEHGARMTAMDKASTNAQELLGELRINYNKARQAAITTELSEIVSGAAALEGS